MHKNIAHYGTWQITHRRGKIQPVQVLQPSDRRELVFREMTTFAGAAVRGWGVSVERVDDQCPNVHVAPRLKWFDSI